jgi:hypothetical protein
MFITIDPYYNVEFYNECLQALKNNNVDFNEYISTKAPYYFYIEVEDKPLFINYDVAPKAAERWLVSLVKPLRSNDEYTYLRRDNIQRLEAVKHYSYTTPFKAIDSSKQGVIFTATKEEVMRVSREYKRKIWFMGRYFNRKYVIFATDNLMIKNFIPSENILAEGSNPIDIETQINYKVFQGKDRLTKYSETPYVENGNFYPVRGVRQERSDKFVL